MSPSDRKGRDNSVEDPLRQRASAGIGVGGDDQGNASHQLRKGSGERREVPIRMGMDDVGGGFQGGQRHRRREDREAVWHDRESLGPKSLYMKRHRVRVAVEPLER